ncbi:hypothetical protein [Desulfosarcina ovata]|uniref:hypothetical protein n=1 Tax=Desulfosarcina ovata TaxID=83564 RepID=UPI0012D318D1|nr:hypothetical protein [Desulfosarcina ovata]
MGIMDVSTISLSTDEKPTFRMVSAISPLSNIISCPENIPDMQPNSEAVVTAIFFVQQVPCSQYWQWH